MKGIVVEFKPRDDQEDYDEPEGELGLFHAFMAGVVLVTPLILVVALAVWGSK